MKRILVLAMSIVLLCSCNQQAPSDVSSASPDASATSSATSSEPSSAASSAPVTSSVPSSTVSSAPPRKFTYDTPLPLVDNDISYFLGMSEKLLPNVLNMDSGNVVYVKEEAIYDSTYAIDDAIYLSISNGKVRCVSIMYNRGKDPTFASLMGINGNDTFDTFVERFGAEYCYPTYMRSSSNTAEEDKSMCSIQYMCKNLGEPMLDGLHEDPFLRANFDENGKMIELFVSYGI